MKLSARSQEASAEQTGDGWPSDRLEYLGRCPSCGSTARSVRFTGLRDKAFRVVDGDWTLHDCSGCAAAYLDPRPNMASIGLAYAHYYTHEEFRQPSLFWQQRDLPSRLITGYINRRFGYAFSTGIDLGYPLISRHPKRVRIDYRLRHLPPPTGSGARLLDVGCGDGMFVAIAQSLGYHAIGLDPDAKAISGGIAHGLDLRVGQLGDGAFAASGFEHITMNHVLEHLHWPADVVGRCFELLTPGGRLWLSQPNLLALGLRRFAENWRGLETPRHLNLFSFESLSSLLVKAGFVDIQLLPSEEAADFYYRQSSAMQAGLDPYKDPTPDIWTANLRAEAKAANRASRADPNLSESLTVTARRPRA